MTMKQYHSTLYILLLAALLTACHETPAPQPVPSAVCISDSMQKMISLDTAKVSPIHDQLALSGEISFDENEEVKIYPFSSGQITQVKVSPGDYVRKGQVLAVMHSADIAGSYQDLQAAGSDVAIARREMENTQQLYDKGISSEKELMIAKENYHKALAASGKLNDQLRINGGGHTQANGVYNITAPVAGFVVEKNITEGSFIRNDNAASLFTLSNLDHVWVWANVFEADIAKVKPGYLADITTLAYPDKVFHARIDKVSEVLDPGNKVMRVRMVLPNPGYLLKPEMFTNVVITNQEIRSVVSVPAESVIFDNSRKFVVCYHDKCHLEIREVVPIKTVDQITYLASGLQAGEVVISKNQILLFRALTEK